MTTTKPTSTDFNDYVGPIQPLPLPLAVNGLMFESTTTTSAGVFIPVAFYNGSSDLSDYALALESGGISTDTNSVSPVFSMHSASLADNFQLVSIALPVMTSDFVITGYNDGVQVAADTVSILQNDSSGSVTYAYAMSNVGQAAEFPSGTLTFGQEWTNIDTVTFTSTTGELYFGLLLDDIVLNPITMQLQLDAGSESGASMTDNITNDSTPLLTGVANAGSAIDIYLDNAANPVTTVQSDTDGKFTVPGLQLQDGTHVISARTQGSSEAATLTVTIDTDAGAPAALALQDKTLQSDTTPTITGTAEAHAGVTLYDGTTVVGTATANSLGAWEITANALDDGDHSLTAVQLDVAGNLSAASDALTVTVDTGRPGTPALAEADDSGAKGDNITNVRMPTLTGTAAQNATVYLMKSGAIIGEGQAGVDGKWSIAVELQDGDHVVSAAIADPNAQVLYSAASGTPPIGQLLEGDALTITIDTEAPDAPAGLALAAASDSGTAGDGKTSVATPTITGTADANATVTLHDGTRLVGTAQANDQGVWSIASDSLAEGAHTLTAAQADVAGNLSQTSTAFNLTIEAMPIVETPVVETPVTTVDGVNVDVKPITLPGGASGTAITVPVVTPGRAEQSGGTSTADIPLSSQGSTALVTAQVHTGSGLSAAGGVSQGAAASLEQLIAAIRATGSATGSTDTGGMTGSGNTFLSHLPHNTALLVQTVTLGGEGKADFVAGQDTGTPVAIVLDGTQLPAGGAVTLKDIPFAAVFGAVTVSSGTPGQILTGDSAGQTFVVSAGAGGSVLAGGGTDVLQFGSAARAGADGASGGEVLPAITLLHGGKAADTAVFTGAQADYTVEQHGGYLLVASKAVPESVAKVVNVETLQFGDGAVAVENRVELTTLAGLYENVLGRQADVDGFAYWAGVEAQGTSMGAIALQIITSAEGVAAFGALDGNAAHDVAILYQGIFNRAPDAAGQAWWADQVVQGVTLEAVAQAMTQSAEIVGHQVAATDWNFTA